LVLSRTAKNAMCLYVLAKIGSSSSIRYNLSDYSLSYKQHMSDTSMLGDANCRGTRQLKEKRNKIAEAPRIAGL